MYNSSPVLSMLVFPYPLHFLAAPASELSTGRQWADQRALSLGPASVCVGTEAARSSHTGKRAARQCPHRRVCNHPDVWSHWRFGPNVDPTYSTTFGSARSIIYKSCVCFSLRAIILCEDAEDVKPVSGVSGPKSSKWCCNKFWEDRAGSASNWGRWVIEWLSLKEQNDFTFVLPSE